MLDDAARTFLQKPLVARMTTIGPDGYPHTVPVWFMLDGDDVVIFGVRTARKVGHIQFNVKGAVSIGGGPGEGGGYLMKGDFVIEEDPQRIWASKITYRYEDKEQAEKDLGDWANLDLVVMRLKTKKVIKV
jgi:hypothetical protein